MSGFFLFARKKISKSGYARKAEFAHAFESDRSNLKLLALLLAGNTEAADLCLSRALQECTASGFVSSEWVVPWARRAVIRSAIECVRASRSEPVSEDARQALINSRLTESSAPVNGILNLPQLDRFVFVICVLEHYPIQDCALLLGKPPRIIFDVLQRIGKHSEPFRNLNDRVFQTDLP